MAYTPAQLRKLADELESVWREESLTETDPAKGQWSPDGLRELARLREQLTSANS